MDLMSAFGELDAELGGYDARAAVGGIAGDADLHRYSYAEVTVGSWWAEL